jgi:hypothetical protein
MKNKKGQGMLLMSALIAFILFFAGMLVISFIETAITNARADNTCTAPATDGTKMLCLLFDGIVPYVFLLIFSAIGGIVISRFLI